MAEFQDNGLQARVDELERELGEVNGRLRTLEQSIAQIRALGQEFWREEAAILLIGAAVDSWHYDVRERNLIFSDVFQCEVMSDSHARRWVGKTGELKATVAINRTVPLLFKILVDGFVTRELAKTFALEIDGTAVAWADKENGIWTALVPPRPGRARLDFRVSVNVDLAPAEKDVTFSFSEISVLPAVPARVQSAESAGEHSDKGE
jgi:hypothetical protein